MMGLSIIRVIVTELKSVSWALRTGAVRQSVAAIPIRYP